MLAGMQKIAILPDILASQVAAGEVVERPASVVKEMVENAIDAKAQAIAVEIAKGGANLIKITDDGSGMGKDDALMCLERHATSKLKDSSQLSSISTMGFRGEAVPSIASVSKFRLSTREHEAIEGTEIFVDGGVVKDVRVAGMQPGTVFEIRNLFFNVPARRKFMRTESTESAHVEHQVKLHALAWPNIRFTYRKDGRQVFDVPATVDKRMRIAALVGQEMGRKLVEVSGHEQHGMEVHGYVLPTEFARKGKRQQYIFLNGRPIEDPAISRALKDAFKGRLSEGLNPSAWLWLTIKPEWVDVNVHPAKKEVRFHRPLEVRQLVFSAVELALDEAEAAPSITRGQPAIVSRKTGDVAPVRRPFDADVHKESEKARVPHPPARSTASSVATVEAEPAAKTVAKTQGAAATRPNTVQTQGATPSPATVPQFQVSHEANTKDLDLNDPKKLAPSFQVIGTLHERYFLLQGDDGLVLMDPKAAQARVIYEAFLDGDDAQVASQGLLVPELIELDAGDLDVVLSNIENFQEAGLEVEPFGGNTIQVTSVPSILNGKEVRRFITEFIDELIETVGAKRGRSLAFEQFAESLAKRSALLAECKLSQADHLIEQLMECDLPYCTPDGKPTLVHLSMNELERKFS